MTRPLRVNNTTPKSLIQMTDLEMEYAAHLLLDKLSADQLTCNVSVNPSITTGLTLIGTFTDTVRPYSIGAHPIGTEITSVTYNFYQDRRPHAATLEANNRTIQFTESSLKSQANANLQAHIVRVAAARFAAFGNGSYKLQTTTPTEPGTWTAIRTIVNDTSGTDNSTFLWKKTANTTPTVVRPVTYRTVSGRPDIIEMTDNEIKGMVPQLREYISTTGIGFYELSESAPVSGGTWVIAGSAFSDTREQRTDQSYSGSYSTNFAGSYSLFYAGFAAGFFTGFYTGFFTGFYTGATLMATLDTVSTVSLWIRTA